MAPDEAREHARELVRKIRLGLPIDETPPSTFGNVCEKWLELVVKERGYRNVKERERIVRKHLIPTFGSRAIHEVRRVDINHLIDGIAEESGLPSAGQVLKTVSAIMTWWQSRDDTFRSPIVKGMARGAATKRDRTLSDDEIRKVWAACEGTGGGRFCQFALLTGQRFGKLTTMRWRDLQGDVWEIPGGAREKGTIGCVRLPPLAMKVLQQQPRLSGAPVFGRQHSSVFLQIRNSSGVHGWTVHDLRRTARSLLSRARISTEISELCLGRAIRGIQQIYDRHSYYEEKSHALAALAQLIENILSPPASNVVALGGV